MLLSRPPLAPPRRKKPVRLACFRHAASVYPEPGSNSPSELSETILHTSKASEMASRRSTSGSSRSPPLFDCQRAPRRRSVRSPSLERGRTSYQPASPAVKTCSRPNATSGDPFWSPARCSDDPDVPPSRRPLLYSLWHPGLGAYPARCQPAPVPAMRV